MDKDIDAQRLIRDFMRNSMPNTDVIYGFEHASHLLDSSGHTAWPYYIVVRQTKPHDASADVDAQAVASKINELFGDKAARVLTANHLHPDVRWMMDDDDWDDPATRFICCAFRL